MNKNSRHIAGSFYFKPFPISLQLALYLKMEYILYNGKFLQAGEAILPADSRALRFGDGLFETLKSHKGNLELANEHFARLWKGLQVLQFVLPKHFTAARLQEEVLHLLKKNAHQDLARVRITLFRGNGGLYDAVDHTPNYLVQSWALPGQTGNWNSNGLVLGVYTDVQKSCDIVSNLKHNNFLPYVMAALHAKKQKWNDALVLNSAGRLCDSTIANIFFIKDETICTPALSEGCVAGIMRKHIIDRIAGTFKITEGQFTVDDLLAADEVFLTNSIHNMRWVQALGERRYSNSFTQQIYAAVFSTKT